MEPAAHAVRLRPLDPPDLPAVGDPGPVREGHGGGDRAVRRIGGCGLAMAERRWRPGPGAFGGDEVGPTPTDRGKNGTKRSLSVEADGGPWGCVVAGANVNDHKLLEATIQIGRASCRDRGEISAGAG